MINSTSFRIFAAAAAIVGVIIYSSVFIVHQTKQALLLQFGDTRRVVTEPGLQFKLPFIQNVIYIDKRILDLDSPPEEVIASDQKRIVVDAFARYRITSPLLFYQTLQNRQRGDSRLKALLSSNMRSVLGKKPLEAFVRDERAVLMKQITQLVHDQAQDFGIKVVDVRIRRADLPEENSQAIFRRMQTERQQEASEIRAIGQEAGREIRATADKDVTVLIAAAYRDSEITRSQGDGCRNRIFASSFGRDPDFFAFYRSMQSYERALQGNKTSLVLSPDSEFFSFFLDPKKSKLSPSKRPSRVRAKRLRSSDTSRKKLCPDLVAADAVQKKKQDAADAAAENKAKTQNRPRRGQ